jgi:hypothetical protein
MANDLTAEEIASLRAIAAMKAKIPDDHKQKLIKLGYADAAGEMAVATSHGRSYLRSLRKPG